VAVVVVQLGKAALAGVAAPDVVIAVEAVVAVVAVLAVLAVLHVQLFPTEETRQEGWMDWKIVHRKTGRKGMTWRKAYNVIREMADIYRARSRRVILPPLPSNNGHEA
jgi:hypothetical protein